MSEEEKKLISYQDIIKNEEIKTYLEKGNKYIGTLGYTEHSMVHCQKVAKVANDILKALGYDARTAELARIAGLMHDIGNVVNRVDHAQTGAFIAFDILTRLGMEPREIAKVISAIGNHDEGTGTAVNQISAALILADKTDVRRSRVRNFDRSKFDIHDRVNYAVERSKTAVLEGRVISLDMSIDTEICSIMDYFEIFSTRMIMCRRAADFLNARFELIINGTKII